MSSSRSVWLKLLVAFAVSACDSHGSARGNQAGGSGVEDPERDQPGLLIPPEELPEPSDGPRDASSVTTRDAGVRDAGLTDASAVGDGGSADASDAGDAGDTVEWVPATPAEPVPDCRAAGWAPVEQRDTRALVVRAQDTAQGPFGAYLMRISSEGITRPAFLGGVSDSSALGGFSGDGQFFAFTRYTDKSSVDGALVVALASGATLQTTALPGWLFGIAPKTGKLLVTDLSLFKLYDVARPDEAPRKTPAPYGNILNGSFSPDGRWLAFAAPQAAQPGMQRLHLDADALELEAPFAEGGENLSWSPDGRALAFTRYIDSVTELRVLRWNSDGAHTTQQVKQVSNESGAGGHFAWLDAERLIWDDMDRHVHLLTLQGDVSYDVDLFVLPQYKSYRTSPGGACVAFPGDCQSASAQGVCVMSTRAPFARAQVSRSASSVFWQDNGARLGVATVQHVEALNLDGAPFVPALVARDAVSSSLSDWSWAPNGEPWLAYLSRPNSGRLRSVIHLWNAKTHATFSIDPEALNVRGFDWAPDGRYLVVRANDPLATANGAPLLVQRIDSEALGSQWTSEGVFVGLGQGGPLVFQP